MPIDTIGQLGLDIADREAGLIESREERKQERLKGLVGGISGSVSKGVAGMESALESELNMAKKREAEEFLKQGVNGVSMYAQELGLDPTLYTKMAQNMKDPTQFVNVYKLMRDKADKKTTEENRLKVLSGAVSSIDQLRSNEKATREDYSRLVAEMGKAELTADKDTALQINRAKDDLMKEADDKFGDPEKKALKLSQASTKQRQKDEVAVEKAMRSTILGGRGGQKVFGNAINKISGIMDGLDTIEGIKQGEFKATKQIGAELGSIIAQVLAPGGTSTAEDRRSLAPESFAADAQGVIQYVTGNPQEAIDDGLLEQLKHMLDRERKFWNGRLKENNAQMYYTVKPVFDRKGSDGKFVNSDLARNWADLMETLAERGEFEKPATEKAMKEQSGGVESVKEKEVAKDTSRQETQTSEKVRVRLPNGKTGLIPRANLQAALSRGAEVID